MAPGVALDGIPPSFEAAAQSVFGRPQDPVEGNNNAAAREIAERGMSNPNAPVEHKHNIAAAFAGGAFAGLAGSIAMSALQAFAPTRHQRRSSMGGQSGDQPEPASAQLAAAVAAKILNRCLTRRERELADPLVHHAFGAAAGAAYAALAEVAPAVTRGRGLGYALSIWLLGDEVTIPALRLSPPPWRQTISTHLFALASHAVYGLTLEAIRSALRPAKTDASSRPGMHPA
jgi:putative membrane protein